MLDFPVWNHLQILRQQNQIEVITITSSARKHSRIWLDPAATVTLPTGCNAVTMPVGAKLMHPSPPQ